ncbi:RagB/SusD family nutrient uptake outer membrane protein [Pedobacter frigidisoli]|uniref:RagB/SusD family nutrient uptake outer membrane protein n=1 Tax=Pedobacter frigidisoli TaxID=2530455 RepID=UPI00292CB815|nr:RagB/SusD family nutrient uptake outer membrane protein [Pedobacter frigidisoli]
MKIIYYILTVAVLSSAVSCKKYVNIEDPKDQLVTSSVFTTDATATAAMVGIYSDMNAFNYQFANVLTSFTCAMAADEFVYGSTLANFDEFKNNALTPGNTYVGLMWSTPYNFIYRANAVIEGVTASTTLTPAVKNQLLGEAKFVRAFCHFYLVNFFGDVPLILNTDVLTNTSKARTPKAEVYASVIQDLKDAKQLLVLAYPGNAERIRPNKTAATLLLSRAYLYTGSNALAETEATEVIATTGQYSLLNNTDPNNAAHISKVFLKNSNEAIWQLQVVNTLNGRNTWEGNTIVSTGVPLYRLTKGALGLENGFEAGDRRYTNWVGQYSSAAVPPVQHTFPFKYKVRLGTAGAAATEYSMVLRFAEAYLIRAEARTQLNRLGDAKDDLNIIRNRAGLAPLTTAASQAIAMAQVEQERRVELFSEWGHRWFDLKRWKSTSGDAAKTRADDVLSLTKTGWKSTAIWFPIPVEAMRTNPNMVQNPGY